MIVPTIVLTDNYKKNFPIKSNIKNSPRVDVVSTVLYKQNTIRSFMISIIY